MKMNTLLPSFMLFACTFQTIALNSETQNTIIKLEQSVISVGQLITQIENQTDYLVVFKSREVDIERYITCLLYTSPSPRDRQKSRMPSSA